MPYPKLFNGTESYESSCVSLWKRNYSEEKNFIFDSECNKNCFYKSRNRYKKIFSPPSSYDLMGTINKVGMTVSPYYAFIVTHIIIEGCYFINTDNEKVDVIWLMTNNSVNMFDPIIKYLNNETIEIKISNFNGDILFDDGSKNCSILSGETKCYTKLFHFERNAIKETVYHSSKNPKELNIYNMLAVFFLIGLILLSILGYQIYKNNQLSDENL